MHNEQDVTHTGFGAVLKSLQSIVNFNQFYLQFLKVRF